MREMLNHKEIAPLLRICLKMLENMKGFDMRLVTLFLVIFGFSGNSLLAQDRAMVVLDASGSMWGQVDGTTKMEIARDAVRDLFNKWEIAGNVDAGLTAYGHRRKSDCTDIELLSGVGPVNGSKISDLLSGLQPRGKTPLSDAVVQAAEAMRYEETKATVILVSDGIETCGEDPCEVGKRLEAAGVDFTAHVIGFDVFAEVDRAQLRCLAENTGGVFTSASNADELTQSLDSFGAIDADLVVPPVVEAGFHFDAVWNGPNEGADGIAVRRIGDTSGEFLAYVQHNSRNPVRLRAPTEVGHYEAVYVVFPYEVAKRRFVARVPIEIVPLRPSISAPDVVEVGKRFELEWRGPDASGDGFSISVAGSEDFDRVVWKQHSGKSRVKIRAPKAPGTYEIRYIVNPYKMKKREIIARRMIVVE